ncbi:MAG: hypothetical protein J6K98_03280 [Clostridia bacterium]|nr:hypothetical protein [Clostridia bacterium]
MATPIFLKGLSDTERIQAGFRGDFHLAGITEPVVLRITGRTYYRVYVNGVFSHYGPARAAHQYAWVDEVDITRLVRDGDNALAVEVCGQNLECQESTGESSFLLAEVKMGGVVLAETGKDWVGVQLTQRRSNVEKYSHARLFQEEYDLDDMYTAWRTLSVAQFPTCPVETVSPVLTCLDRVAPYPTYEVDTAWRIQGVWDICRDPADPQIATAKDPSGECVADRREPFTGQQTLKKASAVVLKHSAPCAAEWELPAPRMGFVGVDFTLDRDAVIDVLCTDRTINGELLPIVNGCHNVVRLHCTAGRHRFETFNPTLIKYLRITLRIEQSTTLTVQSIYLRSYEYPDTGVGSFECSDGALNRIYAAARRTFVCSTLDVFMDCGCRERGGWLCDSFWTARVEKLLFGDTSVNRSMIENYLHSHDSAQEPGFPCCYPSGIKPTRMPTWSMYFLLQLEEYLNTSGDRKTIDAIRPMVQDFLDWLVAYKNGEGLLENLPEWLFVDWSRANDEDHLMPISVAINALYAECLSLFDRLYGCTEYAMQAQAIREKLYTLSLNRATDAPFFASVLEYGANGKLTARKHLYSAAVQYYLYWLGIADKERDGKLLDTLVYEHGPAPTRFMQHLTLSPGNVFIAQNIRFEILAQNGYYEQLFREIEAVYGRMIDEGPGTLWEIFSLESSMCHAFSSHAGVHLVRDLLGLGIPNEIDACITISPHPCGRQWAQGAIGTNKGLTTLAWKLEGDTFRMTAGLPEGYRPVYRLSRELLAVKHWEINGRPIPPEEREGFTA